MFLRKLSVLTLTISSFIALAESEREPLAFGDYVGYMYWDGSGSLGKKWDPKVYSKCDSFSCNWEKKKAKEDPYMALDDQWSFRIKLDEMTDEQKITVGRNAYAISEQFGEMQLEASISLFLILNDKDNEYLCVLGHDFPGMTGMVRVDKAPPLETEENGCMELTKDLDNQLRSGSKITIRGSKFPYRGAETHEINLGGYAEVTDLLRSRRR